LNKNKPNNRNFKRDSSEVNIRSSSNLKSINTDSKPGSLASKRSEQISISSRPAYKDYLAEARENKPPLKNANNKITDQYLNDNGLT